MKKDWCYRYFSTVYHRRFARKMESSSRRKNKKLKMEETETKLQNPEKTCTERTIENI